jgi:lycopene cyclase domain-containing protein
MPINLTYITINFGAFIIPFILSYHPKGKFYKEWKSFCYANIIVAALFLVWDVCYTKIGVWGFNFEYTLGIKIFNLPLEELLFFICIPYASVFTYHCCKVFFPKLTQLNSLKVSITLITGLLFFGFFFITNLYTGLTFILLALLIGYLAFIREEKWLSTFYFMFLIILLPFFLTNGILTGTGIEKPVVWYNNLENLGIRLLTIPIEDVFYGMLLLLLNVFLFEFFNKKHAH